jgi:hypothetical protein
MSLVLILCVFHVGRVIQIVLDQFVLKLIKICYIQIQYIQFCVKKWTILCKIGHVIQIVVHQFVCKTSAKKFKSLKKIGPPLSPGMQEYVESVLRRKKSILYKPYVRRKHVESILGTCKNMTKKSVQFE